MLTLLLCGISLTDAAKAADAPRPAGLTGYNWQFGPLNRWAYTHIPEVLPTKIIRRDPGHSVALPGLDTARDDLMLDGSGETLADAMERLYIDGILAMRDGRVVAERYAGTLSAERTHLLWSVSKTITGLTAASVAADGLIDLDKTVAYYVPELAKSGWASDSLRNVLDMRDGSEWNEDYAAPDSTVRRQDCADGLLAGPDCADTPLVGNYVFLPGVGPMPGRAGEFVYKSGTTDVMAWVLEKATGERFADLVSERLWKPMGAAQDAGITVDVSGFTLASGGMHTTLRDLARVGQLVLDRGMLGDRQIVPAAWIDDLLQQDGKAPRPAVAGDGDAPYYRSFVWGLGDGRGTVQARGVHGQRIHVAPKSGVVIAVFSSWPDAEGGAPGVGDAELNAFLAALESTLTAP